jgi:hypothetical protein
MPTTSVPRPIKGTIGSRVRVIFGDTCEEWLLILNKDNGDTTWQTCNWSNIPHEVATQLQNCTNKGRIVKQVDFGPTGAWYINGQKPDGSGAYSWFGNTNGTHTIKEWSDKIEPLQVSFGTAINGSESRVLIRGKNGYSYTANLQLDGLKQIEGRSKKVNFVRLFSEGNYFISHQEGFEWINTMGDEFFENEIKRPPRDIRDIALAGDGSWVVVRDNKYTTSCCADPRLAGLLHQLFSDQREWNNTRSQEIQFAGEARERAAQEAREQQAREEREIIRGETAEREVLELLNEVLPPARRARISLENESCSPQDLCVVCYDQKPVMAVVPCGHLCLCEGCSSSFMEISGSRLCPLCRGNMQTTMKIYTCN